MGSTLNKRFSHKMARTFGNGKVATSQIASKTAWATGATSDKECLSRIFTTIRGSLDALGFMEQRGKIMPTVC
jgi:hypothetical protein